MTEHVVIGRTESIPGEFANVHVEVLLELDEHEDHESAFERASRLVRERLREEARKRRPLPSATLYDFAEQEGSA